MAVPTNILESTSIYLHLIPMHFLGFDQSATLSGSGIEQSGSASGSGIDQSGSASGSGTDQSETLCCEL